MKGKKEEVPSFMVGQQQESKICNMCDSDKR